MICYVHMYGITGDVIILSVWQMALILRQAWNLHISIYRTNKMDGERMRDKGEYEINEAYVILFKFSTYYYYYY